MYLLNTHRCVRRIVLWSALVYTMNIQNVLLGSISWTSRFVLFIFAWKYNCYCPMLMSYFVFSFEIILYDTLSLGNYLLASYPKHHWTFVKTPSWFQWTFREKTHLNLIFSHLSLRQRLRSLITTWIGYCHWICFYDIWSLGALCIERNPTVLWFMCRTLFMRDFF